MMRLSPQHRDLISVVLLIAILVIAFPLLGSWLSDRVAAVRTPTPAATAPDIPTPTPEPTKESRAVLSETVNSLRDQTPRVDQKIGSGQMDVNCRMNGRAPLTAVLFL